MQIPSGRSILRDIVIFAASGHVIVDEVKRHVNPELRDRAVIAQIIDYASSFAALSKQQCSELFGTTGTTTWIDCVTAMFPDDSSPNELATVLLGRIQRGELNLVIACDKIPSGLPEVVAGIASQHTLGFDLDLVEVIPFVREVSDTAEILFVPSTRLTTQILSRTAVTVTYQHGDAKPSTSVQTTSLEERLESASRSTSGLRSRTLEEVENEFRELGNPVTDQLLQFAKQHSAGGPVTSSSKTSNASFGFYVQRMEEYTQRRLAIFSCASSWTQACIYSTSPADSSRNKR